MEYSVLMLLIPISYTCTYYSVQFYFLPFTMICFLFELISALQINTIDTFIDSNNKTIWRELFGYFLLIFAINKKKKTVLLFIMDSVHHQECSFDQDKPQNTQWDNEQRRMKISDEMNIQLVLLMPLHAGRAILRRAP